MAHKLGVLGADVWIRIYEHLGAGRQTTCPHPIPTRFLMTRTPGRGITTSSALCRTPELEPPWLSLHLPPRHRSTSSSTDATVVVSVLLGRVTLHPLSSSSDFVKKSLKNFTQISRNPNCLHCLEPFLQSSILTANGTRDL